MAPTGKRVLRSAVKNKGQENMHPQRCLTRGRAGRKRKARSEPQGGKRRRHNYNLRRRSGSVEFVCEIPCCDNETLRKYACLGLDSALFHSKSHPAKRKQSHISVVTISTSDDEDSMARTAEWVATMPIENSNSSQRQESNVDLDPTCNKNRAGGEAEGISHQLSLLQIPTNQGETLTDWSSTSFSRTPVKYLGSTCPQSTESSLFGITSEKYQASRVAGSLRPSLGSASTSEKHEDATTGCGECFSLGSGILEKNRITNNPSRTLTGDQTLLSIQETSKMFNSNTAEKQLSIKKVLKTFSFANPQQNTTIQSLEEPRSFSTTIPENHTIVTSLGLEERKPFYFSCSPSSSLFLNSPSSFCTPKKHNSFCLSTSEKQGSHVNPQQNTTIQSLEKPRPFSITIPENHPIETSLGLEERKPFYSSYSPSPSPFLNSPTSFSTTNKHNNFSLSTPEKQGSQEYRPLCSSTPENYQSSSRLNTVGNNTFCNITFGQKQNQSPPEPRYFSKPEFMEVQSSTEVVIGSPSVSTQNLIFENPQHKYQLKFEPHPTTHSSLQSETELDTEKQKEFYFGSLKPQAPSGQLLPSDVDGEILDKDNSSLSFNECLISGIDQISDENLESSQESIPQEAALEEPELSQNSDKNSLSSDSF